MTVCVFIESSVWKWMVSYKHTDVTGRTLKIWRVWLRSDFQAAIVSLSFFACKSRETLFRLLCLITLLWISATVL